MITYRKVLRHIVFSFYVKGLLLIRSPRRVYFIISEKSTYISFMGKNQDSIGKLVVRKSWAKMYLNREHIRPWIKLMGDCSGGSPTPRRPKGGSHLWIFSFRWCQWPGRTQFRGNARLYYPDASQCNQVLETLRLRQQNRKNEMINYRSFIRRNINYVETWSRPRKIS